MKKKTTFPGHLCIQELECYILQEIRAFNSPNVFFQGIKFVPPRTQNARFSTCYIAIFSRQVVVSRNLRYYISSDLCTQELKAQNLQASYALKSSKCHMEVCASRSSTTTFSKGACAFESPKCSKESVPPRAHATTFFREFVPSSACRAHSSSRNSA